jgi:hypothetical protein
MIEFKVPSVGKAEAWCMKHIGPRLYYIHDRIGGEGWRIMRRHGTNEVLLCLEDDKQATMAALTLSGQ